MHSADYAVARCPSVCPSVTRRYYFETAKHKLFHHLAVWHSRHCSFFAKRYAIFRWDPLTGASNAGCRCMGNGKIAIFYQYLVVSQMIKDKTILWNAKSIFNLSNDAISNDLEWPQTKISRARHYSTLNVSETVWDRDTSSLVRRCHWETEHLPSPDSVSRTAFLLPSVIRHCRHQSSESCWKLICLFKGRGAGDLWTGALEMYWLTN